MMSGNRGTPAVRPKVRSARLLRALGFGGSDRPQPSVRGQVISPAEWSRWNVSLRLAVAPAWPGGAGRRSAAGHAANAGTNTSGAGSLYPIEACGLIVL